MIANFVPNLNRLIEISKTVFEMESNKECYPIGLDWNVHP